MIEFTEMCLPLAQISNQHAIGGLGGTAGVCFFSNLHTSAGFNNGMKSMENVIDIFIGMFLSFLYIFLVKYNEKVVSDRQGLRL